MQTFRFRIRGEAALAAIEEKLVHGTHYGERVAVAPSGYSSKGDVGQVIIDAESAEDARRRIEDAIPNGVRVDVELVDESG